MARADEVLPLADLAGRQALVDVELLQDVPSKGILGRPDAAAADGNPELDQPVEHGPPADAKSGRDLGLVQALAHVEILPQVACDAEAPSHAPGMRGRPPRDARLVQPSEDRGPSDAELLGNRFRAEPGLDVQCPGLRHDLRANARVPLAPSARTELGS